MKQNDTHPPLASNVMLVPPKVDPKDLYEVDGKKLLFRPDEIPLVKEHLNIKAYFRKGDAAVRKEMLRKKAKFSQKVCVGLQQCASMIMIMPYIRVEIKKMANETEN